MKIILSVTYIGMSITDIAMGIMDIVDPLKFNPIFVSTTQIIKWNIMNWMKAILFLWKNLIFRKIGIPYISIYKM